MDVKYIAKNYAVAPQISAAGVAWLAGAGFANVICNRPDGEEPGQPSAADIGAACSAAGIGFHHIPLTSMQVVTEDAARLQRVLDESPGPVLAYCRSGQRAVAIYEATSTPANGDPDQGR